MEKTTTITIGGILFSLTESAYEKLRGYLDRLHKHFSTESESAEIMRDIESRIAEKLSHKKESIVTETEVEAIIAEIGEADELEDESENPEDGRGRKLYRDTDNAWIAGVCSGLANYFDVDPLWPRLLFLASLFFGGAGILVYLVLWILIPEAKSASQKLEMHGKPVNLEGIARVVREGVDEVRGSGVVRSVILAIGRVVRGFLRVFGRIMGVLLTIGSFFALIGVTIGVGIIATNWNAPYNDFPLRGVVPDALIFGGLAAGFIVIVIPLVAIFALGLRLIRRRIVISNVIGFGLIGVWAVAVSALGTIAVRASGEFFAHQRTSPEYAMETRELDLGTFTRVSVHNERVTVKKGPEQRVIVEGRSVDMDRPTIEVRNGILNVTKKDEYGRLCIFCRDTSPNITIVTPDLDAVYAENATVVFDEYDDMMLEIELLDAYVRGTLSSPALSIEAENASVRADLTADSLTLTSDDSFLELEGSAQTATIHLEDSSLQSDHFLIQTATLTTDSSYGEVNAQTLTINDDDSSRIVNVTATSTVR